MKKRIIRVVTSSATAATIIGLMTYLGFKLGILRTMEQGNVCMVLGGLLILGLSAKVLMEKEQIVRN